MRILRPPEVVLVCLVLNLVAFVAFVVAGNQHGNDGLYTIKNLFVATLILTVCSLAFVNIETSLKLTKEFFAKKQHIRLVGQVLIISVIVFMAAAIVLYLLRSIFSS